MNFASGTGSVSITEGVKAVTRTVEREKDGRRRNAERRRGSTIIAPSSPLQRRDMPGLDSAIAGSAVSRPMCPVLRCAFLQDGYSGISSFSFCGCQCVRPFAPQSRQGHSNMDTVACLQCSHVRSVCMMSPRLLCTYSLTRANDLPF